MADGSSYTFQYNSYGEVTRLTLPTGGAYQYKYLEVSECSGPNSGVITTNQNVGYSIYRRVQERDELADGVNITAKTIFTATPNLNPDPNHPGRAETTVQVDFQDGSSNLLRRELHYFYGDPISPNSIPSSIRTIRSGATESSSKLCFKTPVPLSRPRRRCGSRGLSLRVKNPGSTRRLTALRPTIRKSAR